MQVYGYCTGKNGSIPRAYVDAALDACAAVAAELNAISGKRVVAVPPPSQSPNLTFAEIHLVLETLSFEIRTLQFVNVSQVPTAQSLPPILSPPAAHAAASALGEFPPPRSLLPLLSVGVSLLQKLLSFAQCETLAPPLAAAAARYNELLGTLHTSALVKIVIAALLAGAIAMSFVGTHVLDRPRKFFWSQHSGRWFRFRAGFDAHLRCWRQREKKVAEVR